MKLRFDKPIRLFSLAMILFFVVACSSGGGDSDGDSGDSGGDETTEPTISEIVVDANPDSINVLEESDVTATVYDESGSPVSGVVVGFSLDQPSLAAISRTATTGSSGVARATLTARDQQGTLTITASAQDLNSNARTVSILSGVNPETINLTATPNTLLVEGTASIRAEVLDQFGDPVPDGTSVSFVVSNTNFGSMSSDADTTINGFANASFIAANQPGTATIEVSVGNINNSVDILINQSQPASIEFSSAEPQRIALAGSGGQEYSDIKFIVVDENGNPVSGISVLMNIESGPNGGEYIDNDSTPEEIEVASDADGIATVTLRSGLTPGPVTIRATVERDGVFYRTNSSVVSIGGGVPSASRFSVSASVLNIPGLGRNGVPTEITAYMSDRYGNYNILEGTTVSFWSEPALAVDASVATVNADGLATVSARTQHPSLDMNLGGKDVAPFDWEEDLLDYMNTTYPDYMAPNPGWTGETTPRDGQVAVLAYTQGEEHFDDLNANGLYDAGETFLDTHDDPFIDYNDNGVYNVYTSLGDDPTEIFNDVNSSGTWDSVNGSWDSQKDIFVNFKLLITGEPIIAINPTTFNIPNGGSQGFTFVVADRNLNYLSAGTTISISTDGGGKIYADSVEMADNSYLPGATGSYTSHLAQIEYDAIIADDDPDDTDAPKTISLTVTVDGSYGTESLTIIGTLD
ncbi:hypothetical protein DSCA_44260 [Desulfosarcina alkanivorans]|uniref:Big-1 domain-containing protein n=1 Tax=Desulfosarcina alkanivorans TaxID=571177 RepID=A0A5K7YMR5_9BACT|nr:Ig-like domain-containing protein [Desulfosarcina alkanivorans]BBO70496.1 hypothetical protein DSCA_44260 [Desulfosarcina alkanivorans]